MIKNVNINYSKIIKIKALSEKLFVHEIDVIQSLFPTYSSLLM